MKKVEKRRGDVLIAGINYSPEASGNAPYTAGLANGVARLGSSVRVFTGVPHYPEWRRRKGYNKLTMREFAHGVSVTRMNHFVPKRPSGLARLALELSFGLRLAITDWESPRIVVLVSPALFSTAIALARSRLLGRKVPVVVWVQDLYSLGMTEARSSGSFAAKLMKWFEAYTLRSADGVVVIHERFRAYVVDQLGVPNDRVKVIRNWTHLKPVTLEKPGNIRTSFGWKSDEIVVLHAGNMGLKQGLENVVEAARFADTSSSAIRFILMGDGNQRMRLEELARGIDRIDFISPLPGSRFQEALAAADILLVNELPGVKEMSVPSKLTSYFSSGVPVLAATDEGSVTAEEISRAEAGLRVDAGDPVALLNAAETLAANKEQGRRFAQNGSEFMKTMLSEEHAIATYDQYLTHLAAGSQPDIRLINSGENHA